MTASATRAESIADVLREAIRQGELVSGERLVELTLSHRLGVSQNTVRDALHILEAEGWVVKHARRGAHVRAFTRDEAAEVYALWAAVECLALRWAIERLNRGHLNQLRRIIQKAHKHALTNDLKGATESLFALHAAIAAACNRPQAQELLARLHNQVHLLEILRQMRAPRSVHSQEAHILLYEKLVSLMEASDVPAAEQLLHYLILSDSAALLALL